jgi:hypothetical protein
MPRRSPDTSLVVAGDVAPGVLGLGDDRFGAALEAGLAEGLAAWHAATWLSLLCVRWTCPRNAPTPWFTPRGHWTPLGPRRQPVPSGHLELPQSGSSQLSWYSPSRPTRSQPIRVRKVADNIAVVVIPMAAHLDSGAVRGRLGRGGGGVGGSCADRQSGAEPEAAHSEQTSNAVHFPSDGQRQFFGGITLRPIRPQPAGRADVQMAVLNAPAFSRIPLRKM